MFVHCSLLEKSFYWVSRLFLAQESTANTEKGMAPTEQTILLDTSEYTEKKQNASRYCGTRRIAKKRLGESQERVRREGRPSEKCLAHPLSLPKWPSPRTSAAQPRLSGHEDRVATGGRTLPSWYGVRTVPRH